MKLSSGKLALCLSGQPRYLDVGYNSIKQLLDFYDIDVFIHTWYDEDLVGQQYEMSELLRYNRRCIREKNVIDNIKMLYSPKQIIHEPSRIFETYDANYGLCLPNSVHSMFYSIYKSNELKKLFEFENKFTYDAVIRCRFDIVIENFLLDDIDTSKYYVSGEIHRSGQYNIPNDQFCISSSSNMDLYSNLFNNLEQYYKNGFREFVGERLLSYHITTINNKQFDFSENKLTINIVKNG